MAIRIYKDKIRFVADSDGDTDIDLVIESDGLRFTGTLTTAYNVPFTSWPSYNPLAGSSFGFVSATNPDTTIEKFPFSISSGTATDVGDFTNRSPAPKAPYGRAQAFCSSSSTDGFSASGSYPTDYTGIDKFPFAIAGGTSTVVANLLNGMGGIKGQSQSTTDAFTFETNTTTYPIAQNNSQIEKFPFSISSGTSTNVGYLTNQLQGNASASSSSTDVFVVAGYNPPNIVTTTLITKFPFAISSAAATDTGGDLIGGRYQHTGFSSSTDGFAFGGQDPAGPGVGGDMEKFPFAISSGTAASVMSMSPLTYRYRVAASISSTDGFASAGGGPFPMPPGLTKSIDKFPFSITSGTVTNVGSLIGAQEFGAGGHQV